MANFSGTINLMGFKGAKVFTNLDAQRPQMAFVCIPVPFNDIQLSQDFNINFLSDDESEQEANIILQPAMRYGMEDEWKEGFDLHYQRKEEPEETDV